MMRLGVGASRIEARVRLELRRGCGLATRSVEVVRAAGTDSEFVTLQAIRVETPEGREIFRQRQLELMHRAAPLRSKLKAAYAFFLSEAFGPERLAMAVRVCLCLSVYACLSVSVCACACTHVCVCVLVRLSCPRPALSLLAPDTSSQ